MSIVFTLIIFSIIGTLRARQPDIDINRIKLLPKEGHHSRTSNFHSRRSIITDHKRNDYDHHRSRFAELRPQVHFQYDAPSPAEAQAGKVYQPKEDPRFFYQSDAYIQEVNRKNLNNEVSSVYMGRGVIRANDDNHIYIDNQLSSLHEGICVRCPLDRTLIAKPGVDRAMLQCPRLQSCSGRKPPRAVRFKRMYGPEFGTLLKEGSHMIVGQITYKGETLQTCKMQIHVLLQSCPVPKYLVSQCEAQNKTCRFTCRDPKAELRGQSTLTCGGDMRWSGRLPVCTARTWCSPQVPPDHGRMSCKGVTAPNGSNLAEGSICRIRCAIGWHWSPRAFAVCRRGQWTHQLTCQRGF